MRPITIHPLDPMEEVFRKYVDNILMQREEIMRAFIAKYGCHPDQVVQIEEKQPDGSMRWHIMHQNQVWKKKPLCSRLLKKLQNILAMKKSSV